MTSCVLLRFVTFLITIATCYCNLWLYFTALWIEIVEPKMTLQTLNITSASYDRSKNNNDEKETHIEAIGGINSIGDSGSMLLSSIDLNTSSNISCFKIGYACCYVVFSSVPGNS